MTITPSSSAWRGKAQLGDGWATFSGHSGDNAPHQHLAVQLVIAYKKNVHINIADGGDIAAPAIVVAANIKHQLMPDELLLVYLEPESVLGHLLTARCKSGYLLLDDNVRDALSAAAQQQEGRGMIQAIAKQFGMSMEQANANTATDRVERLITNLAHRAELPRTLNQFAIEASLSPSRLGHRITSIVGIPFRPYLRWLRLQRAMKFAAAGNSLTQAAHAAGFADAAHLSRTMRRHFGISLSTLLGALKP